MTKKVLKISKPKSGFNIVKKDSDDEKVSQSYKESDDDLKKKKPKKMVKSGSKMSAFLETETEQESNSIILHLPIYEESASSDSGDETSEKNKFTMGDSDSEEEEEGDRTKKENNLIVCLSDEESDDDSNIKHLKNELNKKNAVIKKLQDEINTKSEHPADSMTSAHKCINVKKVSTKIVSIDNNIAFAEKTKIACWWCTHNFDTISKHIPEKYHDGKYYVFGNFCQYECALAYILKDDEYKMPTRVSLIKRLYAELYDTMEPLCAAAPKEILEKFGGPVTIETYRNTKVMKMKDYKMIMAPIPCHFEETYRDPMILSTGNYNNYYKTHR